MTHRDADGVRLLTGPEAGDLLRAAAERAGGVLGQWRLEHVDTEPERATTATFTATVRWPEGPRVELLGASVRVGGPSHSDQRAEIFDDGHQQAAVWIHPDDPDLPSLRDVAFPDAVARLLVEWGVVRGPLRPSDVRLRMLTYRPRRRAVLRADVRRGAVTLTLFLKVLRPDAAAALVSRHQQLRLAGVPAPQVVAAAPGLVALLASPGRPLSERIYQAGLPVPADHLLTLLDALPPAALEWTRRPPWSDSLAYYAGVIARTVPAEGKRLEGLVPAILGGLAGAPGGPEVVTHGDFHEGQLQVDAGRVVGLLDVDTLGPGRRVDDLACLVAHLSTVQRMSRAQAERLQAVLDDWVPVFDRTVDPVELRLRAAAVAVSLATGPFRSQEPGWPASTSRILDAAERLAGQVLRPGSHRRPVSLR